MKTDKPLTLKYARLKDYLINDLENIYLGWLSPDGDLWGSDEMGLHTRLEIVLSREYYSKTCDLSKLGWIKLGNMYGSGFHPRLDGKEPTQKQLDVIFDWCKIHSYKIPDYMITNKGANR